jgi:anaerobic ribonucleoside-triphosphate reductase activating protein
MLIHAQIDASRVNGPGLRAVLFLQGCRLACLHCWNRFSHPFSGVECSADEIAAWIHRCGCDIGVQGVTLSGGEPMHQVEDLCCLVDLVKAEAPGFSFGMFSGYYERELDAGRYWTRTGLTGDERARLWCQLRTQLDFAVLGRYTATQPTHSPLRTSSNQSLRLFSRRYSEADFGTPEVEVTIDPTGLVQITGFPTAGIPA